MWFPLSLHFRLHTAPKKRRSSNALARSNDPWSGKTNLGADRGGLYVSIIGEDGVRYYESHLHSIPLSIEPGVVVKAGRLLGGIGASGSARGTAPHVHFGISWPTPLDVGAWLVSQNVVY